MTMTGTEKGKETTGQETIPKADLDAFRSESDKRAAVANKALNESTRRIAEIQDELDDLKDSGDGKAGDDLPRKEQRILKRRENALVQRETDMLFREHATNHGLDETALREGYEALPEGQRNPAALALVAERLGSKKTTSELASTVEKLVADGAQKTRTASSGAGGSGGDQFDGMTGAKGLEARVQSAGGWDKYLADKKDKR